MHIFLTGEKQVGKSTLVKKVMAHSTRPVFGIRSVSIFENGDRNVYLLPAFPMDNSEAGVVKGGVCRNHHVVETYPEAFDGYGVTLLSDIPSESLVVIDEIGNMERDAEAYSMAVLDLLKRDDIKVLGVVQKMARTPLAEAVRTHRKVRLLTVDEENRDTILERIEGELK